MSPNPSLPVICIGVGISSLFKALMEPAFNATITDMLSEEDFAKGWNGSNRKQSQDFNFTGHCGVVAADYDG